MDALWEKLDIIEEASPAVFTGKAKTNHEVGIGAVYVCDFGHLDWSFNKVVLGELLSIEEKVALKLKVQTIASQMMVNIQTEPQPLVISAPTEQKTDADAQQPL